MLRLVPTLIVAAAGSTSLGALLVQEDRPGRQDPPGLAQGHSMQTDEANRVLAAWLHAHNEMTVEISRFAAQRAQDPEVKQFAQKVVTDHEQFGKRLDEFAGKVALGGKPGMDDPTGRPAEAGAGRMGRTGFDHTALVEELGTQFLQTARTELEKKQGAQFDRCYMQMALMGHMKANDMMTVFERHATGELKSTLDQGQQTVQQHLEKARTIAQRLEPK